ncbi:Crp/Fnr family transcriptional regulator [Elioraea sp.]|uniref:Crp/Fnr family transcriptional regulator n=1 Tax=Elioraea sp. TaxID=2185103 RepID=UPI0025C42B31|nr:helix-turn-helix domain-containing protein [Elioraea sp.]
MAVAETFRVVAQRIGTLPEPCAHCDARERNFCAALDPAEMAEFSRVMTEATVSPGGMLFHEGTPADYVMNVTSGTVKMFKLLGDGRRQILGFRFAGDFLGLSAGTDYVYSAEALAESQLCRFPRRKLDGLRERFPGLNRRLLALSIDELTAAQEQLLLLGRKTAEERLVSFLILLSQGQVRRGLRPDPVTLPMTRSDIADYLGLTIETVSRTFSSLRKKRLIELEDTTHVHLVDRDKLEEMAAGFA